MTSYELRHHFPWLGTDEEVSGADVIAKLNELYKERVDDENDGESKAYVSTARAQYNRDGEVEIDDNAVVSRGDDGGAYVAAWVWVDAQDAGVEPEYCECGREFRGCTVYEGGEEHGDN